MERGSGKHGSRIDEHIKEGTQPLERSGKESRAEGFVADETVGDGEGLAGTQSSAEVYPYQDHGETGGASHPKPREDGTEGS